MSRRPTPTILMVGPPRFPRYVILADISVPSEQRRYWTGEEWIDEPRLAILYADERAARDDARKLGAKPPQF